MADDRNGHQGKLPPQNLEAERSVIGGCLLDNRAIDEAQLVVEAHQFYADPHRRMFAAICDLRNKNLEVDAVLLGHELQSREELAEIGGPAYIATCMEAVPHAAHTAHYAQIVREKWVKRTVIDGCTDTLRMAYSDASDLDDVIGQLDASTQRMLETSANSSEVLSMSQVLLSALDDEDRPRRQGKQTGFTELDTLTGGMVGGSLIIIGARPSMGKTAFAIGVMLNLTKAGTPVLFFSLEQSSLEISERILSMESKVSLYKMKQGDLGEMDHFAFNEARNALNDIPLEIDERSQRNMSQISATARLLRRTKGIQAVVIDYLQLIDTPAGQRRSRSREEEISDISRSLKLLARSLDVPVIVLAQLNRDVEKRTDNKPRMSDLRNSGALEQDADQIWLMHRPDYYEPDERPGEAEILVEKNRNGPTGKVVLQFIKESMRFVSVDVDHGQRTMDW